MRYSCPISPAVRTNSCLHKTFIHEYQSAHKTHYQQNTYFQHAKKKKNHFAHSISAMFNEELCCAHNTKQKKAPQFAPAKKNTKETSKQTHEAQYRHGNPAQKTNPNDNPETP